MLGEGYAEIYDRALDSVDKALQKMLDDDGANEEAPMDELVRGEVESQQERYRHLGVSLKDNLSKDDRLVVTFLKSHKDMFVAALDHYEKKINSDMEIAKKAFSGLEFKDVQKELQKIKVARETLNSAPAPRR